MGSEQLEGVDLEQHAVEEQVVRGGPFAGLVSHTRLRELLPARSRDKGQGPRRGIRIQRQGHIKLNAVSNIRLKNHTLMRGSSSD